MLPIIFKKIGGILLIICALSCMIPLQTDKPTEQFHFAIAGTAMDTMSPFGPLFIMFTRQVKDPDSVHFIVSPPFSEYQVLWNDSHDTAELDFASPLDGNAEFAVRLANTAGSTDGAVLYAGKDSLKFFTYPCEQEPNGSKDLADTLTGTVFGHIAMANDTDWFLAADTAKRAFYLKSNGSTSSFTVIDAEGVTASPAVYADAETLQVPIDFVPPLYLRVYAYNYSNGGSYELGWVKR